MSDNPALTHPALAPVIATGARALTDRPCLISDTIAQTVLARVAWESYQCGRAEAINELRTTEQMAALLGISASRVAHRACDRGVGWKIGRDYLFAPADVAAMQTRTSGRPRKSSAPE